MGSHWSLWQVSLSLVAPPLSCPGIVDGIILAVVSSPRGGGGGSSDDAACSHIALQQLSSWHWPCWGSLSLGHCQWLCPAPAMELLRCFHCSMSEEFGLPGARKGSLLCPVAAVNPGREDGGLWGVGGHWCHLHPAPSPQRWGPGVGGMQSIHQCGIHA